MVESIAERVKAVNAGAQEGVGLCVVPILGPSHDEPEYRLLEDGILDAVKVTETSPSGSVPELLIENALECRVFLIDGQELLGAKQNRILNTDVLVPAKTTLRLPVSCVEQGRWRHETSQFSPGKAAPYRTRRDKAARVHHALAVEGRHDADQSAVWREVAEELEMSGAVSYTVALSDAYAVRQKDLDELRNSLTLPDQAVGLAVFHDGQFKGVDLFDRHSTLVYFWQSLVDSYAIDWLHRPDQGQQVGEQTELTGTVTAVLEQAARGDWEGFRSPGEGRDFRLALPELNGSALVWDERVVLHLQLFPMENGSHRDATEEGRRRPRVHRRYVRRTDRPTP